MYFELDINYEKNIKGVYYTLTANKTFHPSSVQELEEAIKIAQSLIIENHAVITLNIVDSGTTANNYFYREPKMYCRWYNDFNRTFGHVTILADGTARNTKNHTGTQIKKIIAHDIKNAFEKCLFNDIAKTNKISYIVLEAAFKDLDKSYPEIWKHDKGLLQADLRFIYNAYINYLINNETSAEFQHLNYLLDYDTTNSSIHVKIIKDVLKTIPEVMTA